MQSNRNAVEGSQDISPVIYKLNRREEMGLFGCDWDRTPKEEEEEPNPCYLGDQHGPG